MAGLENLTALIYHEQQQEGSMLCAQHALNSLLQGHYFMAPDLSEIARQLDELEGNYDQDHGQTPSISQNMDDTGFFSIQVLEHALKVWGLSLVRWRGEDMRPYQDRPHTQLAFILNHEQHWYTLRRFGPAWADFRDDPGFGHWYNLNSFLPRPEWVGKLYLGMVLHQAESEGYSVFVVVQTDASSPLALPRTEADHLAGTLPEPGSTSHMSDTARLSSHSEIRGPDDEDWELQMALHASLEDGDPAASPPSDPTSTSPSLGTSTLTQINSPIVGHDFGAASRRMLQRMQAEQVHVQRELWSSVPRPGIEDENAETLQRALAQSESMTRTGESGDDDSNMESLQSVDTSVDWPRGSRNLLSNPNDRNYDDEDEELQAALKASLDSMTGPWSPPSQSIAPAPVASSSSGGTTAATTSRSSSDIRSPKNTEAISNSTPLEEDIDDADLDPSDISGTTPKSVDLEEMRRLRLARFDR
ncbi:Josephin-domain-containing protein [Dendrothele bispora CBS 962.96]|uniref:ubiquitinyl hydrolase 1 n=1 Tax=Dendrothele bispora (strain CBS 962.96) TaxID=1314807 RepID=A0A4S8M1Y9_DENBC|nr:Josephin-domain-containing protein [Dendrothele bispora CBS 962.96]